MLSLSTITGLVSQKMKIENYVGNFTQVYKSFKRNVWQKPNKSLYPAEARSGKKLKKDPAWLYAAMCG